MLVAIAGLPGTGKSTLARALIEVLQAHGREALILDKDDVRASLFRPEDVVYSRDQDDLCVDIMLQVAGYLLHHAPDRIVILDGRTFSRRGQVETVIHAAADLAVPLVFIECHCSEATAVQRLAQDQAHQMHPAKNRGPDLYRSVRAQANALTISHLDVDTQEPLADNVQTCLAYLLEAAT
ncbi:MAG: ATP-binding protein [Anaerolineae bacterium]|nr:ATP-binding protein [Anaerolineae bacterium]